MMSTDPEEKTSNINNSLRVDFHCHTTCSDGHLSPKEIIDRATNYQIDQIAITDHDTVNAISLAQDYIEQQQFNIRLVSGIEFSTLWQNFEIHVLGLNIDCNNPLNKNSSANPTTKQAKSSSNKLSI